MPGRVAQGVMDGWQAVQTQAGAVLRLLQTQRTQRIASEAAAALPAAVLRNAMRGRRLLQDNSESVLLPAEDQGQNMPVAAADDSTATIRYDEAKYVSFPGADAGPESYKVFKTVGEDGAVATFDARGRFAIPQAYYAMLWEAAAVDEDVPMATLFTAFYQFNEELVVDEEAEMQGRVILNFMREPTRLVAATMLVQYAMRAAPAYRLTRHATHVPLAPAHVLVPYRMEDQSLLGGGGATPELASHAFVMYNMPHVSMQPQMVLLPSPSSDAPLMYTILSQDVLGGAARAYMAVAVQLTSMLAAAHANGVHTLHRLNRLWAAAAPDSNSPLRVAAVMEHVGAMRFAVAEGRNSKEDSRFVFDVAPYGVNVSRMNVSHTNAREGDMRPRMLRMMPTARQLGHAHGTLKAGGGAAASLNVSFAFPDQADVIGRPQVLRREDVLVALLYMSALARALARAIRVGQPGAGASNAQRDSHLVQLYVAHASFVYETLFGNAQLGARLWAQPNRAFYIDDKPGVQARTPSQWAASALPVPWRDSEFMDESRLLHQTVPCAALARADRGASNEQDLQALLSLKRAPDETIAAANKARTSKQPVYFVQKHIAHYVVRHELNQVDRYARANSDEFEPGWLLLKQNTYAGLRESVRAVAETRDAAATLNVAGVRAQPWLQGRIAQGNEWQLNKQAIDSDEFQRALKQLYSASALDARVACHAAQTLAKTYFSVRARDAGDRDLRAHDTVLAESPACTPDTLQRVHAYHVAVAHGLFSNTEHVFTMAVNGLPRWARYRPQRANELDRVLGEHALRCQVGVSVHVDVTSLANREYALAVGDAADAGVQKTLRDSWQDNTIVSAQFLTAAASTPRARRNWQATYVSTNAQQVDESELLTKPVQEIQIDAGAPCSVYLAAVFKRSARAALQKLGGIRLQTPFQPDEAAAYAGINALRLDFEP